MRTYNKFAIDDNGQLEFEFAAAEDGQPSSWAVRHLADRVGISDWHMRTAMIANGFSGQRDD